MSLPLRATLTVDGQPALVAGTERTLRLEIRNDASRPLILADRPPGPSPTNHHLALHLPAGTLDATTLARVIASDGWRIHPGETADGENRWDSLFLLHSGRVELQPGETLVVLLHGVAARVGGSTHHASAVLTYELSTTEETGAAALRGSRALRLYVQQWADNPAELHLHAGVYAGADVLNVGEVSSRIELRVTATSVDGGVGLVAGVTRIELAWDVGPSDTHWWALCTGAQAEAVEVSVQWEAGNEATTDPTTDAVWLTETGAVWSATAQEDRVLAEGDAFAVLLDGLETAHPTGPANLYLRVLGVNGTVSGTFVLKVRKQPFGWSEDGGLTLYAGDTDSPLTIRSVSGEPAMSLQRGDLGHALTVHRTNGAATVRLDSAGTSTIGTLDITGPVTVKGATPLQLLTIDDTDRSEVATGRAVADWVAVLCSASAAAVGLHANEAGLWTARYVRTPLEETFGVRPTWWARILFLHRSMAR